jgi:hypothetical protein
MAMRTRLLSAHPRHRQPTRSARSSGRHRAESRGTRLRHPGLRWAAAVATAAAGLAVPFLISPGSAGAATTATWNRLAGCESGGNWHINTGNGYYGGLQFSQGTWVAMGGRQYADRADLASPAQQMAIGENLLRASHYSWSPWPVCSRKLGLTRADALATDQTVDGVFVHRYVYRSAHPIAQRAPLPKLKLP